MVANMKVGKMDGFCVGEPWNARVDRRRHRLHRHHHAGHLEGPPGKGLRVHRGVRGEESQDGQGRAQGAARSERLARRHGQPPRAVRDRLQGDLHQLPEGLILGRLQGNYDYGDGRKLNDPNYMIFSERNCNYPQPKYAKWWLTQFRRWGMVDGAPDYEGVAKQVMRADIYEEAMKEIGYAHGGADNTPETLFDGVTFDPADAGEVREGLRRSQHEGVNGPDTTPVESARSACAIRSIENATSSRWPRSDTRTLLPTGGRSCMWR